MGKTALLSKHVVLAHLPAPVYALILILDELICEIVLLDDSRTTESLLTQYADWNPQDYSELYISAGLVDLSVRREFEDYSSLTQAAVSGGVTFLLEEESFYCDAPPSGEFYCDVGSVATVDSSDIGSLRAVKDSGCCAIKGYLYPPCSAVACLPTDLEFLFEEANSLNLPVILDPTLPDPVKFYSASPYRLEPLTRRLNCETHMRGSAFAAAFSEDVPVSENSEEEVECVRTGNKRRVTNTEQMKRLSLEPPLIARERSISEMTEFNELAEIPEEGSPRKKHTIYSALDSAILQFSEAIENLSAAEQTLYQFEGKPMSSSSVMSSEPGPRPPSLEARKRGLNLSTLSVRTESPAYDHIYNLHLANYAESWEVAGIGHALQSLRKKHCRLHLCSISSAKGINTIRQAKSVLKSLTCEIGAVHLYFNSDDIRDKDTRFKNSCPVRNKTNFCLLWELLKLKGIDVIASQHSNILATYKASNTGSFCKALNGINCLGFSLQAAWTGLNSSRTSSGQLEHYLVRLSKWLSLVPAQVLGTELRRGSVAQGKFADLIVWAPYERVQVTQSPEMCPFLGLSLYGRVHKVFLRGRLAYDQGQFHSFGRKVVKL